MLALQLLIVASFSTRLTSSLLLAVPPGQTKSSSPSSSPALTDRAKIGTLDIPHLGVGTIAWVPDSSDDDASYAKTASLATANGLTFIDTAERYGAKPLDLIPAAINTALTSLTRSLRLPVKVKATPAYLGGDGESNLSRWTPPSSSAIFATKFTPKPDRLTSESVVAACRASCARLGVESLPLYQLHFPDVIQPRAKIGLGADVKDEVSSSRSQDRRSPIGRVSL